MAQGHETTDCLKRTGYKDPLQISIHASAGKRRRLDESLALSVRITNIADEPLWMVGVLPGSDGLRYPKYVAEIDGPAGLVELQLPESLDYVRGLRLQDFVRLRPGESFDPQGEGFIPIQQFAWFQPDQPGMYRLRVVFDATSRDARQWMGHTAVRKEREVERLIRKVPSVRIQSNTLEIQYE